MGVRTVTIRPTGLLVARGLAAIDGHGAVHPQLTGATPASFPLLARHHAFFSNEAPAIRNFFFRIAAQSAAGEAAFMREVQVSHD